MGETEGSADGDMILTTFNKMCRLLRHERQWQTEEGILLHNARESSGAHAANVVGTVQGRRR